MLSFYLLGCLVAFLIFLFVYLCLDYDAGKEIVVKLIDLPVCLLMVVCSWGFVLFGLGLFFLSCLDLNGIWDKTILTFKNPFYKKK